MISWENVGSRTRNINNKVAVNLRMRTKNKTRGGVRGDSLKNKYVVSMTVFQAIYYINKTV